MLYQHGKVFFFFLFMMLGLARSGKASVDVYGTINMGEMQAQEDSAGTNYTNRSTFFVGHWGYSLGTRAKITLGSIGLGLVGELGWIGDSLDRKTSASGISGSTYRNEFYRSLAGASLALQTGSSAILLEHYPWVQNSVTYSDEKSQNPFRKNDKLNATGYGFGFNFGSSNTSGYQLMYKKLQYKNVMMNGTSVTLPNTQYQVFNLDEISFGFILKF